MLLSACSQSAETIPLRTTPKPTPPAILLGAGTALRCLQSQLNPNDKQGIPAVSCEVRDGVITHIKLSWPTAVSMDEAREAATSRLPSDARLINSNAGQTSQQAEEIYSSDDLSDNIKRAYEVPTPTEIVDRIAFPIEVRVIYYTSNNQVSSVDIDIIEKS